MNLFVIDYSPEESAKYVCDRHCIKMCLETAQLLCIPFQLQGIEAPYKLTHKNHPVAIWVRETVENFQWAADYGFAICKEYAARYGRTHKCEQIIQWCDDNLNRLSFSKTGLTAFAQAMPEMYQNADAVQAYRDYYRLEKQHLHQWKRNRPTWI